MCEGRDGEGPHVRGGGIIIMYEGEEPGGGPSKVCPIFSIRNLIKSYNKVFKVMAEYTNHAWYLAAVAIAAVA